MIFIEEPDDLKEDEAERIRAARKKGIGATRCTLFSLTFVGKLPSLLCSPPSEATGKYTTVLCELILDLRIFSACAISSS